MIRYSDSEGDKNDSPRGPLSNALLLDIYPRDWDTPDKRLWPVTERS